MSARTLLQTVPPVLYLAGGIAYGIATGSVHTVFITIGVGCIWLGLAVGVGIRRKPPAREDNPPT